MCNKDRIEEIVKILTSMIHVNTDNLEDTEFIAKDYGFYDFFDNSLMNKNKYEELLKNMRHDGLIEITLDNTKKFERAKIYATKEGVSFLYDHTNDDED